MNLLFIVKIIILCSVSSFNAYAKHNLVLQYAGEIGRYAIGYGYNLNHYNIEFIYGYHPELNTYTLKNTFTIYKQNKILLKAGFSFYQVDSFNNSDIPYDYYEQSINKRAYLFYSIAIKNNKNEFYFENGINDVSLEAYYNNSLDLNQLMSIGFGYRFHFN